MRYSILCSAIVLTCSFGLVACNKAEGEHAHHQHQASGSEQTAAHKPGKGQQTIAVTADDKGFTPSRIELKKGAKATLRFTRTSDTTCAKKVVFPDLKVEKDLPLNQPVDIEVPTAEARTLAFQCGMGMYKSSVVVK